MKRMRMPSSKDLATQKQAMYELASVLRFHQDVLDCRTRSRRASIETVSLNFARQTSKSCTLAAASGERLKSNVTIADRKIELWLLETRSTPRLRPFEARLFDACRSVGFHDVTCRQHLQHSQRSPCGSSISSIDPTLSQIGGHFKLQMAND